MLNVVEDRIVNYDGRKRKQQGTTFWNASDITTMVTAGLVLLRIVSNSWAAMSAWRCAFIMLETDGLSLLQFQRTVSWRIPCTTRIRQSFRYSVVAVILVLMIPSNFMAPILSGAIGWRDVQAPVGTEHIIFRPRAPEQLWYWYLHLASDRFRIAQRAAGYTNLALANKRDPNVNTCRYVSSDTGYLPNNTTVKDIRVPCIDIHDISWDQDREEFVTKFVDNPSIVSLTDFNPPFSSNTGGDAMLFNSTLWKSAPATDAGCCAVHIRPATIFSGVKYIALVLTIQIRNNCTRAEPNAFGDWEYMASIHNLYSKNLGGPELCIRIGTVNLTAGVYESPNSMIVAPGVIEATRDEKVEMKRDPWVEEALFLLPDVMTRVAVMNSSMLPTWEKIDDYVKHLIRHSYMGTWSILRQTFDTEGYNFTAGLQVPMLQATVSHSRVWVWFASQILLTVSGVLLVALQWSVTRPVVVDSAAVSLMVDPSSVLNEDKSDQTIMSYVSGQDSGEKLRLVHVKAPSGSGRSEFVLSRFRGKDPAAQPLQVDQTA